ncbi:unnamed protein product [Closterium sp. NIES-53]
MEISLYFIVTRLPDSLRSVRDHFRALDPTNLTIDLLEQHLLAAERTVVADVGAASASGKHRSSKGKGGRSSGGGSGGGSGGSSGGGGGSGGGGSGGSGGGSGGFGGGGGGSGGSSGSGGNGSGGTRGGAVQREGSGGGHRQQQQRRSKTPLPQHLQFGDEAEHPRWAELLRSGVVIFDLYYDAILAAMYALSVSAEGDCYLCVLSDPDIEAAALGASESALPATAPAEALHTFTLDSGASHCFFRDITTLTPLSAPVPVRLADPSGGPVLSRSSTVLPYPAVPSGSLSACVNLHVYTDGLHLATFTRRPGSSPYTLATRPPQVAASAQVSASGPVAPPSSCSLLSHQSLPWHHRLGHPSLPRLRGMHSRLLVSGLPRSLPPLPPSPTPPCLPCVEGRQCAAPHTSSFPSMSAPLQTLHMDVWDPARVIGQGREHYILLVVDDYTRYTMIFPLRSKGESFTLPASPQQNGIDEHRIGLVMEVARTSMIHVAAPHFLWLFVVWSPSGTPPSPSGPCSLRCISGRPTPPGEHVEVAVDTCSATGATSGGAASGGAELAGAEAKGAESEGARSGGAEPGGAEPGGAEPGSAEPEGAEPGGAESEGAKSGGAEPRGSASSGGIAGASPRLSPRPEPLSPQQLRELFARRTRLRSGAARAGDSTAGSTRAGDTGATSLGGAGELAGAGGPGGAEAAGPGGACTRGTGAAGAGGAGGAGARGVGAGDSGAGGIGAGGARAGDPGAGGAGAVDHGAGGAGAGGAAFGRTGAAGVGAGDPGAGDTTAGGAGPGGARAVGAGAGDTGRLQLYFVPLLQQVLDLPSSTRLTPPLLCPPPDQSQPLLQPASPLPAPPYTEQTGGLTERREAVSRPASPVCAVRTSLRVPRQQPPPVSGTHHMALLRAATPTVPCLLATVVTDPSFESVSASALVATLVDFDAACRLNYAASLVAESKSDCPPSVGGECALGTDILEDRQDHFECFAAAVPHLVSMLIAPEGDPYAPDVPNPRSYAEAITGPYSSQWQTAMDTEMAFWKSTGTYVNAVPPRGANIVDGMWIFKVKRPSGSPPAFKARYVARGFRQRQEVDFFQTFSPTSKMTTLRVLLHVVAQRDYELRSLDFSTTFLQGSMHEEIWLHRPTSFTGSFPAGTQWSLQRPVYGLRQAPREWHDTLRTTLASLGFAPPAADPVLFLHTDTSLPLFYVLVYVFQRFGFWYSLPQSTPLPTSHSLSTPPLDKCVEPSGLYPELVGCLITSGMGLVLGGRGPVVLTGHADLSWVDDSATQRSSQGYTFSLGSGSVSLRSTRSSSVLSSSCEAEIYAGAMAAQELCWLTYLLTDLGE